MPILTEYQAFASAGAKTVDGTIGTGAVMWAMIGASFKVAGEAPLTHGLVPLHLRPGLFQPGIAR